MTGAELKAKARAGGVRTIEIAHEIRRSCALVSATFSGRYAGRADDARVEIEAAIDVIAARKAKERQIYLREREDVYRLRKLNHISTKEISERTGYSTANIDHIPLYDSKPKSWDIIRDAVLSISNERRGTR